MAKMETEIDLNKSVTKDGKISLFDLMRLTIGRTDFNGATSAIENKLGFRLSEEELRDEKLKNSERAQVAKLFERYFQNNATFDDKTSSFTFISTDDRILTGVKDALKRFQDEQKKDTADKKQAEKNQKMKDLAKTLAGKLGTSLSELGNKLGQPGPALHQNKIFDNAFTDSIDFYAVQRGYQGHRPGRGRGGFDG